MQVYAENQALTLSVSPGSWTLIPAAGGEVAAGTNFETHVLWSRQGVESGDITITWGGTSVWNTVVCAAYTGRITTGDPQDATATFAKNETGSSTALLATGLTTAHADADVVAFGVNWLATTSTWSGVTERADFAECSVADAPQESAGASGNKAATLAAASVWGAGLVALRTADPPPPPPDYPDASLYRLQPSDRFYARNLIPQATTDAAALILGGFFEAPSGGGGDVTVGLTGVAGTGAAGSFSPATSKAITGNAGTGAAGTLAQGTTRALTGVAGAGAAGTLATGTTAALSGNVGTGAAGTIVASTGSPDVTVGLTGVSGTGGAGSVAVGVAKGLTGNSATGAVGTLGLSRAQALTGVAGTGASGALATALSKALTGAAGTGSSGSLSLATSKALTGVAATGSVGILAHSRTSALTGVSGTGSAGTLAVDSGVVADPVEIVFTVRILRQRSLTAAIATTAIRTMAVSKMVTTVTRLIRSDVRLAHITKQVRITEQR
jgi:hypothetical protein